MVFFRLIISLLIGLTFISCGKERPQAAIAEQEKGEKGFVYYMGNEWSKRKFPLDGITPNKLLTGIADNTVLITDGLNNATGSYMGKTDSGRHLVMTNKHVIDESYACSVFKQVKFEFLYPTKRSFYCRQEVISIPEIDLAIVELDAETDDPFLGQRKGLKLAKDLSLSNQHPFITAGFGGYKNQKADLVIDQSDECRLISPSNEYKELVYKRNRPSVWSIAIACDISVGDSGSALMDPLTGLIAGVIWSGVYPKFKSRVSFNAIDDILTKNSELLWSSYNYAVPADKIQEEIEKLLSTLAFNFDIFKMRQEVYQTIFY